MADTLSLVVVERGKQKAYRVDHCRDLKIQYSKDYDEYLLSFKYCGKECLVGTRHFHITGRVYKEYD